MNPGAVERVVAFADFEEAGRLNEAALAYAVDLQELHSVAERTVRLAIFDQIAGDELIESRHMAQQRHAGRVQIDAHLIDARFDHAVQRLTHLLGADIVLIQTDADVLRIDLDQLAERVLQASADRDGSAQRGIEGWGTPRGRPDWRSTRWRPPR